MHRRDILKLSPFALGAAATSIGHHVFAEAPSTGAGKDVSAIYNVRNFGATGDGKTVDTPAINKAIEAVAAAGGGTLIFPVGTYMCFSIRLKSFVDIYLSRGCTIVAAASPLPGETTGYNGGTYDAAEPAIPGDPYDDFGHYHWHNSLFWAEGQENFSILGPGLIHGAGLAHGGSRPNDIRGPYPFYKAEQAGVGNKAIAFKNCHNVILRDFSVLKGGHFALLATACDNLICDNLLIDTDRDGFDFDCCRNVRCTQCTVNSPWDDGICPKSSYVLGYNRPTDNLTIDSCFVTGYYVLGSVIDGTWKKYLDDSPMPRIGRIKLGTESNGGFRNVAITNCIFEGCRGLCLETSDGAFLEDVAISNITMRDIVDAPLFLRLGARLRGPETTGPYAKDTLHPGTLRRVLMSNIVSHNSASVTSSIFTGIPGNLIEDVKLSNCFFGHRGLPATMPPIMSMGNMIPGGTFPDWHTIQVKEMEKAYPELGRFGPTPSNGFFIRHLKNLEMSHVEVAPEAPDPRPAFWLEDVHRADFFAVTAPPQPNFSLHNVTDLRIFWSRAAKDTTLAQAQDQLV